MVRSTRTEESQAVLQPDEAVVLRGAPAQDLRSLASILRTIWRRRRWVKSATLLGFGMSLVLAFTWPARYSATAQIMPPESKSSPSALLSSLLGSNNSVGSLVAPDFNLNGTASTYVGVLNSETIANRIVQRFDLLKLYRVRTQQAAREELAEHVRVGEDRKTGIISITVTDHEAKRAADMAKAYADELDQLLASLSMGAARRERIFLEGRLVTAKQELEQAEQDLAKFSTKSGTLDIHEQAKVLMQSAATLEASLIVARSELDSLRQMYTDNNVRVRALQARVNELQAQLNKFGSIGPDQLSNPNGSPDSLVRRFPNLGVTYADLYRRTKVTDLVFETLTQQYELAKVQEAKETPRVKILDAPTVPEKRSFPPRIVIIICGTLACFLLSVGFALAHTAWNEASPDHPLKQLRAEIASSAGKSASADLFVGGDLNDKRHG